MRENQRALSKNVSSHFGFYVFSQLSYGICLETGFTGMKKFRNDYQAMRIKMSPYVNHPSIKIIYCEASSELKPS